jgi:uncharacterized protein YndB with AHSA1/START domain
MDLTFKVQMRIAKPIAEVFEAVVNPDALSNYFTTGGASGRLEPGATVMWDFADFPGAFPVEVAEVVPNERIVLNWDGGVDAGGENYQTRVDLRFAEIAGDCTLVSISESGWRENNAGIKSALGNSGGWMQMLCCMKAWLEYGIRLRDGAFSPEDREDKTAAA